MSWEFGQKKARFQHLGLLRKIPDGQRHIAMREMPLSFYQSTHSGTPMFKCYDHKWESPFYMCPACFSGSVYTSSSTDGNQIVSTKPTTVSKPFEITCNCSCTVTQPKPKASEKAVGVWQVIVQNDPDTGFDQISSWDLDEFPEAKKIWVREDRLE